MTYNMPFHKLLGIRLNRWKFLALVAFPAIVEDVGDSRTQVLKNTGRFNWLKPSFGCRIFSVR